MHALLLTYSNIKSNIEVQFKSTTMFQSQPLQILIVLHILSFIVSDKRGNTSLDDSESIKRIVSYHTIILERCVVTSLEKFGFRLHYCSDVYYIRFHFESLKTLSQSFLHLRVVRPPVYFFVNQVRRFFIQCSIFVRYWDKV